MMGNNILILHRIRVSDQRPPENIRAGSLLIPSPCAEQRCRHRGCSQVCWYRTGITLPVPNTCVTTWIQSLVAVRLFGSEQKFGNRLFAWRRGRSCCFSLRSPVQQSFSVEFLALESDALIISYDFTQFETQLTVICV